MRKMTSEGRVVWQKTITVHTSTRSACDVDEVFIMFQYANFQRYVCNKRIKRFKQGVV